MNQRTLKVSGDAYRFIENINFLNHNVYITNSQTRFSTNTFTIYNKSGKISEIGVSKKNNRCLKLDTLVDKYSDLINFSQ